MEAREVGELVGPLALAVERTRAVPDAPVDSWFRTRLGRRVLEQLRAEVIRVGLESDASPGRVLAILGALERLREEIELELHDRLSGPEGLDVLLDVAHDLRSPLTSILFLADTLQRGQSGPVNELQARQLGLIYGAALGLSSTANDIIELSVDGRTLVDGDAVPFSMAGVFESVRDIVRPIAEQRRLIVRLSLPPVDRHFGYPVALGRVLLNLTTNALNFTDHGFVELVARERTGMRVEFSVRDSGRGIEPGALRTLYAPLRRAARRSGLALSHTGLGLALCRRLVAEMGGSLEVESHPGRGSRFFFELPLSPCLPAALGAETRETRRGGRRRAPRPLARGHA